MKPKHLLMAFAMALFTTVAGCGACNSMTQSFNEGFCPSFEESFLQSCTDTCAKDKDRATCAKYCGEELPKQKMYANRCLTGSSSPAPATSP